jgi:hypothetical protein
MVTRVSMLSPPLEAETKGASTCTRFGLKNQAPNTLVTTKTGFKVDS